MTREEAKEVFLNRGFIDGIYNGDKWREACIVISKWLEQEPTTKNDLGVDCVSRKAVINQIFYSTDNNGDVVLGSALRERIARLPSVTPQLSSGLEKNSKKLEKDFGELDCISREQALRKLKESAEHHANDSREEVLLRRDRDIIRALPSVTPQEPRCKDCKWWKDSDGEYRRGCGAESQCPINRREVFEGNGYCYLFEPQESEDKE